MAPASGSGQPPKTPRFEQLSCVVDRNHTHNLIGRLATGWLHRSKRLWIKQGRARGDRKMPATRRHEHGRETKRQARHPHRLPSSSLCQSRKRPPGCAPAAGEDRSAKGFLASTTTESATRACLPHSRVRRRHRSRRRRQHLRKQRLAPPPAPPPPVRTLPLLPPRHPSRASAATTGAGATEQEAAAREGTGFVLRRGRQGKGWGR